MGEIIENLEQISKILTKVGEARERIASSLDELDEYDSSEARFYIERDLAILNDAVSTKQLNH